MLYKLFSTKVDQRYLQLVHWYKRRHTSYPSRFVFMADRSMHCVMLNNQSFRASVAGDKSRDLQANEGVCSQGAGREGLVGWAEKKYLKDITLIVLCRRVQLNSIKTNPKEILFAFHFSSCKFWIHHYKVNLWLIVKKETLWVFPFCSVFQKSPHLGQSQSFTKSAAFCGGPSLFQLAIQDAELKCLNLLSNRSFRPCRDIMFRSSHLISQPLFSLFECKSL